MLKEYHLRKGLTQSSQIIIVCHYHGTPTEHWSMAKFAWRNIGCRMGRGTVLEKKLVEILLQIPSFCMSGSYAFSKSSDKAFGLAVCFWPIWRNTSMLKSQVFCKLLKFVDVKWRSVITLQDVRNSSSGKNCVQLLMLTLEFLLLGNGYIRQ